jgi:hypothetical protein
MIEDNEAIVDALETDFFSTVSKDDSWQRQVLLAVPDRNYKRMRTVVFSVNYQLSKGHCHICSLGRSANPKFHRLFTRSVYDELLSRLVVNGSGQNSPSVGAVRELCKGEATDVFYLLALISKLLMLLGAQVGDRLMV